MSNLRFFEALKVIFCDIESFLAITLKTVNLPKAAGSEKGAILVKLKNLQEEYPQLQWDINEKPAEVTKPAPAATKVEVREKKDETVKKTERVAKGDSEIYDAIGDDIATAPEPSKPSSTGSEASDVPSATVGALELMKNTSMSGHLTRKNVGKKDIKSMLMMVVVGRKWCVVSCGMFYIFDKLTSKKQSEAFPLKGYEVRLPTEQLSKKEFCFDLVCPGQKSYGFAAQTQDELDRWSTVLAAEALKNPDPRMSAMFCDVSVDDDEEYEDTSAISVSPPAPRPNLVASKLSGRGALPVPQPVDDGEELYDDVCAATLSATKEAPPTMVESDDDLVYEAYDDVKEIAAKGGKNVTNQAGGKTGRNDVTAPNATVNGGADDIDYEKMFYGKWDCKSDADNELAFRRGDVIQVLSQEYDRFGWWIGKLKSTVGLVPRDYLVPAYELVAG